MNKKMNLTNFHFPLSYGLTLLKFPHKFVRKPLSLIYKAILFH